MVRVTSSFRKMKSKSVWRKLREQLVAETEDLPMGNVTDLSNFMGAVIDDRAFAKAMNSMNRAILNAAFMLFFVGSMIALAGMVSRSAPSHVGGRPRQTVTRARPPAR